MVLVDSTMLPLGTEAPDFALPDTNGNVVQRDDFKGNKGLLVIFLCNHCPYVHHVRPKLAEVAREYQQQGIGIVGINSNDVSKYPDDSPEKMKAEVETHGYTFPYLFDESQQVAHVYRAACTPDFFLFDGELKLVYRGQFDASRPNSDRPLTGEDLRAAMDAVLGGKPVSDDQKPSAGCNIKWKPGNEPDYFK